MISVRAISLANSSTTRPLTATLNTEMKRTKINYTKCMDANVIHKLSCSEKESVLYLICLLSEL